MQSATEETKLSTENNNPATGFSNTEGLVPRYGSGSGDPASYDDEFPLDLS